MAAPAWSDGENETFERALATNDPDEPGRWDHVAAAVGGGKTADVVKRHYDQLVDDLRRIEAGGAHSSSGAATRSTNGENNGRRPQT